MKINKKDIKIENIRGNHKCGGQHLNKTSSCVVLTHIPTGVKVKVDGRCQHQNKKKAFKELESRLEQLKKDKIAQKKKERRDKVIKDKKYIRTYDFNSGLVKDHRNGKTASVKDVLGKGKVDLLR